MSLKLILLNFFIANTNNISTNNEITEYKEVKYGLIIFSMIIFTINIIGIKKMCQIDHKIKFEEWVLISGILETILLLIYILHKKYEILLTIIQALQIIITLFITRRFLKGYLIFSENDTGPNCYNYYYIILVIVNIIFIIVCLILNILSLKKGIKTYYFSSLITLIYDLFGSITSFILLIFGLKLKKLMIIDKKKEEKEINQKYEDHHRDSIDSSDNSSDKAHLKKQKFSQTFLLIEATEKDVVSIYDIFFNTRITQLNTIIWVTFITDLIECIASIFEMIYNQEFKYENGKQTPNTKRAYIIRYSYLLCIIISTFMNWFTLYFIVRKTFEIQSNNYEIVEKKPETNMIALNQDYNIMIEPDKTNQNVDDFLKS
jgi:hypothetical protein